MNSHKGMHGRSDGDARSAALTHLQIAHQHVEFLKILYYYELLFRNLSPIYYIIIALFVISAIADVFLLLTSYKWLVCVNLPIIQNRYVRSVSRSTGTLSVVVLIT